MCAEGMLECDPSYIVWVPRWGDVFSTVRDMGRRVDHGTWCLEFRNMIMSLWSENENYCERIGKRDSEERTI